jgi:hypothetical protein
MSANDPNELPPGLGAGEYVELDVDLFVKAFSTMLHAAGSRHDSDDADTRALTMNGFLWTAVAFAGASVIVLGASINSGTGVAVDDYSSLVSGLFGICILGGIAIVLATIGLLVKLF